MRVGRGEGNETMPRVFVHKLERTERLLEERGEANRGTGLGHHLLEQGHSLLIGAGEGSILDSDLTLQERKREGDNGRASHGGQGGNSRG